MDKHRDVKQSDAWNARETGDASDVQAVRDTSVVREAHGAGASQAASEAVQGVLEPQAAPEAAQTAHATSQTSNGAVAYQAQKDIADEASKAPYRASKEQVHQKLAELADEDPALDPYEIEFLPEFRQGRGPEAPFVNEYGVVIGDHMYDSPESPLNKWSKDTDPAIMAGDQWVHPFKDIGFQTEENRELFERGIPPQSGIFMHPFKDVAYEANREPGDEEEERRQD